MTPFIIEANGYLRRETTAFYHVPYLRMGNPGNPDYLNVLKNTFNNFARKKLISASRNLQIALELDVPQILQLSECEIMTVCVVPRSKIESSYHENQLLFKRTVQSTIRQTKGFEDGTYYIYRHTDTRTTHLPNLVRNYNNDGPIPYPGITADTCTILPDVRGKDVLLIDDIYTPGVNVDEDAIEALLNAGARAVTFYAVGKTMGRL